MKMKPNARQKHGPVLQLAGMNKMLPLDAVRKGVSSPLWWIKWRTPADTSADGRLYQLRRQAVKAMPGGWAMLSVYDEMATHYGGNQIAPTRGFVINHDFRVATPPQVAQAISCGDVRLVKRAMEAFVEVGLLEWVECPAFEAAIARDLSGLKDGTTLAGTTKPVENHGDDAGEEQAGQAPATTAQDGPQTPAANKTDERAAASSGPSPGGPGAAPRPAAGQPPAGKPMTDLRLQPPDGQTPDAVAASAAPSPQSADGIGKSSEGNGLAVSGQQTADSRRSDRQTVAPPPGASVATADEQRPDTPTADGEPGAEGTADAKVQSIAPQHAGTPGEPTADAAADVPTQADPGRGAPRCFDYQVGLIAERICTALYPTREDLVTEGRRAIPPSGPDEFLPRELGEISSVLDRVYAMGLDGLQVFRVIEKAQHMALSLVKKKNLHKPRGCMWTKIFGSYMSQEYGPRWSATRRSGPP